ncbi:hypothetical protein Acor_33050 [Acrocarpospora corrugata]|uniref:Uncharacterized protein n=1 Tax=Acrocarpospora corrugata TaxID=35763 RepID=A0A5M3W280_9ACTN|nr:SIR2 family protein [Acrocarpospora corrugata]GES01241.1 hypothetical protein Acor_33050 [Acrocarpospora corrugata]
MDEADWQRLTSQLRRGDCTPFLGAGACVGALPTGTELSTRYAIEHGYPFTDDHNLARVMQYAAAELRDSVDLKTRVCEYLQECGRTRSAGPNDPHAVLARFPLDTFLTTNYDNFLAEALRRRGKQPTEEVSAWWEGGSTDVPVVATPDWEKPLVYYLHGSWAMPRSLVLTEADYLNYLVNMVDASAYTGRFPLPTPVLRALTMKPLLFLGYSLQDWTFRVLFHGLARSTPRSNHRRHVSVQIMPGVNDSATDVEAKAERYLAHYLHGWNISTFFGTATDFCAELEARTRDLS